MYCQYHPWPIIVNNEKVKITRLVIHAPVSPWRKIDSRVWSMQGKSGDSQTNFELPVNNRDSHAVLKHWEIKIKSCVSVVYYGSYCNVLSVGCCCLTGCLFLPISCDESLHSVSCHDQGKLLATGSHSGSITLLELSDFLSTLQPNEKQNVTTVSKHHPRYHFQCIWVVSQFIRESWVAQTLLHVGTVVILIIGTGKK